jgi:hypothetical protein
MKPPVAMDSAGGNSGESYPSHLGLFAHLTVRRLGSDLIHRWLLCRQAVRRNASPFVGSRMPPEPVTGGDGTRLRQTLCGARRNAQEEIKVGVGRGGVTVGRPSTGHSRNRAPLPSMPCRPCEDAVRVPSLASQRERPRPATAAAPADASWFQVLEPIR